MDVYAFFSNVAATVVGGVVLAFLFFLSRERLFPLPKITGRWYFEMRTTQTIYRPYENMVLRYIAILWREGHGVEGTVEKVYEYSSTGKREYIGENRTRGVVQGYVEKNYLGKDRVYLHVIEQGQGRESTNFYELSFDDHEAMNGTFSSLIADQSGVVKWQREEF